MAGHIAALYRHPVKGFTPEPLSRAQLSAGAPFPCDRLYAVETGPSGFDPTAPAFVSKQKFAVLAALPQVAKAVTAFDEDSQTLSVQAKGLPDLIAPLGEEAGRQAFADW
ncbi:MAG: MOSC N-terminal beta barrel domain-containing protein, partial [Phenylobacterium sp.]|uniref:MOSC N-terminal beta barrel domain-containing protein n=1 Tax=Phenylobacterium sp. TaxID=1871053 RepID=UPI0025E87389